jgi:hypothetical protein
MGLTTVQGTSTTMYVQEVLFIVSATNGLLDILIGYEIFFHLKTEHHCSDSLNIYLETLGFTYCMILFVHYFTLARPPGRQGQGPGQGQWWFVLIKRTQCGYVLYVLYYSLVSLWAFIYK